MVKNDAIRSIGRENDPKPTDANRVDRTVSDDNDLAAAKPNGSSRNSSIGSITDSEVNRLWDGASRTSRCGLNEKEDLTHATMLLCSFQRRKRMASDTLKECVACLRCLNEEIERLQRKLYGLMREESKRMVRLKDGVRDRKAGGDRTTTKGVKSTRRKRKREMNFSSSETSDGRRSKHCKT
ncbi:hypothetical protein Trydic_g23891 [Trypoxylus dichotomus]